MNFSNIIVFIYGILIFIGGLIGFAKAHSIASLVAGLAFAILLIGAGILMLKKKPMGLYLAAFLSMVLMSFFFYRFLKTFQFMPAGFSMLLSAFTLAVLLFEGLSKKRETLRKQ